LSRRPAPAVGVPLLVIAIGLGSAACGVAVASGAARLAEPVTVYVANCNSDTVTAIRGDSRAGAPVKVGRWPCAIAITPSGTKAFVVGVDPGTVTAISTATNTAGRPVISHTQLHQHTRLPPCDPD
jgi:DNA-binding beta-propeller fold protein YncE